MNLSAIDISSDSHSNRRRIGLAIFFLLAILTPPTLSASTGTIKAWSSTTATPTATATLPSAIPPNLPVITVTNMSRLKPIARLSPGEVIGATWSPDGNTLALRGKKGLWLYTLSNLHSPRHLDTAFPVTDVAFSSDAKYLAAETTHIMGDLYVQLWDISTDESIVSLPNVAAPVFTTDRVTLIVRDLDYGMPRLLFWDIPRGKYRTAIPDVYLAVPSSDGKRIACAEDKQNANTVTLRNAETGQVIRVLDTREQPISNIVFDPSGKQLAVLDSSGVVAVWTTQTGSLVRRFQGEGLFEGELYSISFSADGTLISVATLPLGHQGLADIFEVTTGKLLDRFLTDYGSSVYFTRTTSIVVEYYGDDVTFLRSAEGGADFRALVDPKFNPARTLLALNSYRDKSIYLYAAQ